MGIFDFLRRSARRPRGVLLALGGGGARGLAHIGVLSVLEEAGVRVAGIAGTSAGAVVGAMWLTMGSSEAVLVRWRQFLAAGFPRALPDVRLTENVTSRDSLLLQFARRLKRHAIVALALERRSWLEHAEIEKALAFLVEDRRIEDLPLPFMAVATDFATGEPVVLRHGPLRLALMASSAIPAVLPPYLVGGRALVDGGSVADVPVVQARLLGRRPLVAVDVGEEVGADDAGSITLPRAILRGATMTHKALRDLITRDADLVVRPAVGDAHWSEFGRLEELVEAGRKAALHRLPQLLALSRRWAGAGERPGAAAGAG
ncbi:MAG TPA: patatin-like phospholipase family protein [Thermoanaerobaculaceae bacterium]|nr:patatin-like phospholipase family protein [Thermoanaerobaculaceae bacterium]